MRDLIALLTHCLRVLLGHSEPGRHRATATHRVTDHTVSTPRLAAPRPRQTHPLPAHVEERFRPIIGEQVALVRPYLINFEQQHERDLQRERRTAAALADLGIDYDVTAVLA